MSKKILVTGGAGFIGSFIVDKLIEEGHDVRIFDNLEPQVHQGKFPNYVNKKAEFIQGDVLDYEALKKAIEDVEVIFHESAMVGVGQSMYQVRRYVAANTLGTANLLDILVNTNHDVKKILVAASMSSYGEGSYECKDCGVVYPKLRTEQQMAKHDWEIRCTECGKVTKPIPTKETKPLESNSIYAITKKDQEEMFLNIGKTYGLPAVALRYFNVYGPRQSLNNPYTGVAAIFMTRIKNDNSPVVFEDGLQTRDFVNVKDIAAANISAMKSKNADFEVFNVGGENPRTIKEIAEVIARLYGKDIKPTIVNKFRKGDVRHCFADISKIKNGLGWKPSVSFEQGMLELIRWAETEESVDMVDKATNELKERGLVE